MGEAMLCVLPYTDGLAGDKIFIANNSAILSSPPKSRCFMLSFSYLGHVGLVNKKLKHFLTFIIGIII